MRLGGDAGPGSVPIPFTPSIPVYTQIDILRCRLGSTGLLHRHPSAYLERSGPTSSRDCFRPLLDLPAFAGPAFSDLRGAQLVLVECLASEHLQRATIICVCIYLLTLARSHTLTAHIPTVVHIGESRILQIEDNCGSWGTKKNQAMEKQAS